MKKKEKINIGQEVNNYVKFLKSSIFIRLTSILMRICTFGHWIQLPIIFEVNIGQKVNIGQISEVLNFHPIDLKFEQDFQKNDHHVSRGLAIILDLSVNL